MCIFLCDTSRVGPNQLPSKALFSRLGDNPPHGDIFSNRPTHQSSTIQRKWTDCGSTKTQPDEQEQVCVCVRVCVCVCLCDCVTLFTVVATESKRKQHGVQVSLVNHEYFEP
jgi:hypothetical protein